MALTRLRLSVGRVMVAVAITAVGVWLWACRFAGLDEDQSTACVVMGIFFGLPILGISAFFALVMKATSGETPPAARSEGSPQLTIGCLMMAIVISAAALALFWVG